MIIDRAWNGFVLEAELAQLKSGLRPENSFFGVTGSAPAMRKLCALAEKVAASNMSVVIPGGTGTGKDVMARAIHAASACAAGAVCRRHQLRGYPAEPAGKRGIRPREGHLHRRSRTGSGQGAVKGFSPEGDPVWIEAYP